MNSQPLNVPAGWRRIKLKYLVALKSGDAIPGEEIKGNQGAWRIPYWCLRDLVINNVLIPLLSGHFADPIPLTSILASKS